MAILGIVVAYALLGLLALARRFLPWWSKIPQVSASASVSPEEIARVDARISQQQGSIKAVWDTLNRQGAEFKEKFDGLAKSAERGRIAYQVAQAMLVLRDRRDCHRKLKKINGWLDALTGKANADTKVVCSADHISVNLYELGQDMLRFIPWKPDELRSEIATLNGERKKSRVLAVDMGTSNSNDQEKQGWKFLSDEVKCYHAFLVKARGHYIQVHRAPISEGSPEP